jgi:hypothetical protein
MKTFFLKNTMEIGFVLRIVGKGYVDSEHKIRVSGEQKGKKQRNIELFEGCDKHSRSLDLPYSQTRRTCKFRYRLGNSKMVMYVMDRYTM